MSMDTASPRPVVRRASDLPDRAEAAPFPYEPAFAPPQHGSLAPSCPGAGLAVVTTYLGYRLQRTPNDLRLHVRRTLCAHEARDASAVCAALVDLFCVLGDKGLDLRRTLLERVADVLTAGQREVIEYLLLRAPTAEERDATAGARLSPPMPTAPVIIRRPRLDTTADVDAFGTSNTDDGACHVA